MFFVRNQFTFPLSLVQIGTGDVPFCDEKDFSCYRRISKAVSW